MLEIEYERSLNHNYMIVKRDTTAHSYKDEMLLQNLIEGLLPMDIRRLNSKSLYCYDVTGVADFATAFGSRKVTGDQLRQLLISVLNIINNAGKYLLEEDDFILLPEQIFVHIIELEARLCYLPGYKQDIRTQFQKLLEYFMNQIKYDEQETVVLVYSLYMKSKEIGWGFTDFYNILKNSVKISQQDGRAKEKPVNFSEVNDMKETEVEKLYYPIKSYLLPCATLVIAFLVLFVSFKFKFVYNTLGTKIDVVKLVLILMTEVAVMAFSLLTSFSKKRLCSRMEIITTTEEAVHESKINSRGWENQEFKFKTEEYYEDNSDTILLCDNNDTVLLCDNNDKEEIVLIPAMDLDYDKIVLTIFPFFVGKLKLKSDAYIENPKVSKIHAKINKEEDGYYLYDLNSTNGTFINGGRLPVNGKDIIRNGDLISFADIDYIFSCPSSLNMIKSNQMYATQTTKEEGFRSGG